MFINKKYIKSLKDLRDEYENGNYSCLVRRFFNMLPIDVYVDADKMYEWYSHEVPYVFIPNTYINEYSADFYVITVEENPKLIAYPSKRKVLKEDVMFVMDFIRIFYDKLMLIAEDDSSENFKRFSNKYVLNEDYSVKMLNLQRHVTSCPDVIWIDEGSERKHGNRIKIKRNGEWISIYLDGKIIGNRKLLDGKEISKYLKFVKANKSIINGLYNKSITRDEFLKSLVRYGDDTADVILSNLDEVPESSVNYKEVYSLNKNHLVLVQFRINKKFNFLDKITNKFLYVDEDGEPLMFDYQIGPFIENEQNELVTYGMINNHLYALYLDGSYKIQN